MNKKNKTEYNLVLILIILVITVNLFFIYLYGFSNTKDNFDILEKQTENYFPSFYKLASSSRRDYTHAHTNQYLGGGGPLSTKII